MTFARFDDLSGASDGSFRLIDPVGELVARRLDDVPGVLARAEREAAAGRWVAGFVAYEAAPAFDGALSVRSSDPAAPPRDVALASPGGWPLVWFGVFHGREAVSPPEPAELAEAGEPLKAAEPKEAGATEPASGRRGVFEPLDWRASVPRGRYMEAIERIRASIAGGETYQVNYTVRLRTTLSPPARADDGLGRLYADLVLGQRGAFGAYLGAGRFRVLSASPELFFERTGDRLVTRPMKGTARRGRWPEEDARAAEALRSSSKDRAENAMIVDLLRNDLGRVAVPGTVVADPLFEVERYETVWQMTSTVAAEVAERTSLVDIFAALFPSGSVTGAPKVASMRMIAELEDARRMVYTGAIGFLAPPGSSGPRARFGVGIRTVAVDVRTGAAEYGVGAGITFASDADAEYEEVQAKSWVLFEHRPRFGLFEALAFDPDGGYRHLEEHLLRLSASARYFGFHLDLERVRIDLDKFAADASAPMRMRLTLERDGSIALEASRLPNRGGPVRLAILESPRVDPGDVWLFHKTTRRGPYERRRGLRPDADDVLLVNTRGHVTESTIANVAVRLNGSWWTPPLDDGLLPGAYRTVLLREGRLRERPITVAEARAADEVALVSSVRGWRTANLVD